MFNEKPIISKEINYVPIDETVERKIIAWFGDAIARYDMLPKRDGCYRIAAMCGEQVVGFAAICVLHMNRYMKMVR